MQTHRRTLKDWIVALRPWSFSTSSIPVLAMAAYLFFLSAADDACSYDWVSTLLCLPMLLLLHGGSNLISDYYDHMNHVDLPGSLNGVDWIDDKRFSPQLIRRYGGALIAAGAAVGVVILLRCGPAPLWIGALAVALAVAYHRLKARALGDLCILFNFALLPAVGVCRVATGCYHPETLLLCLPYGLLTISILHVNNTRDTANDRRAGLLTLPMLTGWRTAAWIYVAELMLPYVLTTAFALAGSVADRRWLCLLLPLVTLPTAVRNCRTMLRAADGDERAIVTLDQASAQLQLLFGLLYALSFIIGGMVAIQGGAS